jgi:hypothetical protein
MEHRTALLVEHEEIGESTADIEPNAKPSTVLRHFF